MARNGSGTYSLPAGNPVVSGTTISSTWANNTLSDIATAMTASVAKDGQTTPTANLPMGGFKHTGVADGTARNHYGALGQIQDGELNFLTTVAGTDTITATLATPTLAAYVAGLPMWFVASGTNTGAVTININSIGAIAVTKTGAVALAAGDITSGYLYVVVYDGTRFQLLGIGLYAKLGANSDITSLLGLTTALSIGQGGTGLTTAAALGQCYLSLSGGNLKLSPVQGNKITINGVHQTIPSAGVTLAPTGLTVSALYYIYAYMNAGTMTLEASATGHSTDTTTGVEIKTADATRTLVGMCVPQTGPVFADSGAKRLVLSWFNRANKEASNTATTGATTTSASFVELNTADRILFLSWANESIIGNVQVSTTSSSSSSTWAAAFGLDGTGFGYANFNGGGVTGSAISLTANHFGAVSEGSHYGTPMGLISGGATLTAQGGGTSSIRAMVRG